MSERDRLPVIVGVAQHTDRDSTPDQALGPLESLVKVARATAVDAGARGLLAKLDSVVVVRSFPDSTPRVGRPFGGPDNPPWSLAREIGATPRELLHTSSGGNMPLVALARACDQIAEGRSEAALIAGAEVLRTQRLALRAGLSLNWDDPAPDKPQLLGEMRPAVSEREALHGLNAPIHGYPLFEIALRAKRGTTPSQHMLDMGRLFEPFAAVAAGNPFAARRQMLSAEEIATETAANRMISYPYTRLMNANVHVDQAAALIVCSEAFADRLGIAESRRVRLHGAASGNDHWYVTERPDLSRSEPIHRVVAKALDMAGSKIDRMSLLDIYSCFPSAVEVACAEIGVAEDDRRGLTVTGGLPYFGGPGNNYVTHAIAEIVQRLRLNPGCYGLVTGNGNYLTKHAAGVFSTKPLNGPWESEHPSVLQAELDGRPRTTLHPEPNGRGHIETYTVSYGKDGPAGVIIIGRLDDGARFIARLADGCPVPNAVLNQEMVGRAVTVSNSDGLSTCTMEAFR